MPDRVGGTHEAREIQHPVYKIPFAKRPAWFRWGIISSLVVFLPLISVIESGPGIVQLTLLVFSGTTAGVDAILSTWSESDRLAIAFANGLDYLFGILLFGTLAIGCAAVTREDGSVEPRAGRVFVWLATLGVVLDVPENTSYLVMIFGDTSAPWPQVALVTCGPRFAIFFLCAAFIGRGSSGERRAA